MDEIASQYGISYSAVRQIRSRFEKWVRTKPVRDQETTDLIREFTVTQTRHPGRNRAILLRVYGISGRDSRGRQQSQQAIAKRHGLKQSGVGAIKLNFKHWRSARVKPREEIRDRLEFLCSIHEYARTQDSPYKIWRMLLAIFGINQDGETLEVLKSPYQIAREYKITTALVERTRYQFLTWKEQLQIVERKPRGGLETVQLIEEFASTKASEFEQTRDILLRTYGLTENGGLVKRKEDSNVAAASFGFSLTHTTQIQEEFTGWM